MVFLKGNIRQETKNNAVDVRFSFHEFRAFETPPLAEKLLELHKQTSGVYKLVKTVQFFPKRSGKAGYVKLVFNCFGDVVFTWQGPAKSFICMDSYCLIKNMPILIESLSLDFRELLNF